MSSVGQAENMQEKSLCLYNEKSFSIHWIPDNIGTEVSLPCMQTRTLILALELQHVRLCRRDEFYFWSKEAKNELGKGQLDQKQGITYNTSAANVFDRLK